MLNGKFIGVKERANVFCVECKFMVRSAKKVTVRATALGVYFAEVNGVRAGDAYLAPGWTEYNKTLQVQEYDITSLVKEGENILSFTVGEGWCCGPLIWERKRGIYYTRPAVCADLIADGKLILSTDESWTARESFIRESGIYDGETQDFTAERKPQPKSAAGRSRRPRSPRTVSWSARTSPTTTSACSPATSASPRSCLSTTRARCTSTFRKPRWRPGSCSSSF